MVKRKKTSAKNTPASSKDSSFMGMNKSQAQSLAIGVILIGVGLFGLAGYSYTNKQAGTPSILPDGAATTAAPTEVQTAINNNDNKDSLTTPGAGSLGNGEAQATSSATPTVVAMKQITPTISPLMQKEATKAGTVAITKLPNTSSKVTYTVQSSDSLAKIGKQLCGTNRAWLSLIETNNLEFPYTIHPGQTIIITCN